MTGPGNKKSRLGQLLVEEGLLSEEQLSRALAQQKSSGQMLGEMLVDQGIISHATLVSMVGRCVGVRGCLLRHGLIDPPLLKLIGEEEAQRLGRLLRPKHDGGQAHFYSVVSRDTLDAEYAAHRQRFLAEQGYAYRITDADDLLGPAIG